MVFDLLDAMSSRGRGGPERARNRGGDAPGEALTSRTRPSGCRLTEPAELFRGLGFEFWVPPVPAVLGPVTPEGPAARAGLKAGDRIVAIDGAPMNDFRDIVDRINARPGASLRIDLPARR